MSALFSDAGALVAMSMLILAAGLSGFGLGFAARSQLERRRRTRLNAALDGQLREIAPYVRTKGEPFTNVLRRHERDARREQS